MARITLNTNVASLKAQGQLRTSTEALHKSFARLSSGVRINRASDDAAGLALSSRINVDKRVAIVGTRNFNNGISMLNTAEVALKELTSIVIRIEELATQASNGTVGESQRQALDSEAQALASEYERIAQNVEFNGIQLLSEFQTVRLQGGYGEQGSISVELGIEAQNSNALLSDVLNASLDSSAAQGNLASSAPDTSSDGRYVVFQSSATNLVAGDTNGRSDVFLRDTQTGITTRVSVDSLGVQGDNHSYNPSISDDGRYIAFESSATNLVAGDTNFQKDIFLHDTVTGDTTRVSVDSLGTQSVSESIGASISGDGKFIAFEALGSDLVAGDTNGGRDIFVHNITTAETTRVSVDSLGTQSDANSFEADISSDGRYVTFTSLASNLVAGDTNGTQDIFRHDRQTGITTRVSVDSLGAQANNLSIKPAISGNGRYVTFESTANNLVSGDTNSSKDIFLHDTETGTTTRLSVDDSGVQGNNISVIASISHNGRYIAFQSTSTNLVPDDSNSFVDVFVHDRETGTTRMVSLAADGTKGNNGSNVASISSDGRYITFASFSDNLVASDTNNQDDIFLAPNSAYQAPEFSTLPTFDLLTQSSAQSAIDLMSTQRGVLTLASGSIGASQSRLQVGISNLKQFSENTAIAESRITDIDVAEESSNMVRNQILRQAAAAVLAQANQELSVVLTLLGEG
jgi:flagellin-like hook-associated protein FlgL